MNDKMLESAILWGIITFISFSIIFIFFKIKRINPNDAIKNKYFPFALIIIMFLLWVGIKYLQTSFFNSYTIKNNIQKTQNRYDLKITNDYIEVNGYKISGDDFKLISEIFNVDTQRIEQYSPYYDLWKQRDITPIPIMKTSVLKSDNPIYHFLIINFVKYKYNITFNNKVIKPNMTSKEVVDTFGVNNFKPVVIQKNYDSLKYETSSRKIIFGFTNDELTDMTIYLVNDVMKYLKK